MVDENAASHHAPQHPQSGIEGDHVHDDGAADAGKPAKAASNDRMAAEALGAAAAGGHVEAMRFLLSRGMFGDRYVALPLYDPTIMAKAMANGRLEAVKYLHDLALTDDRQCACNPDHHHDPTWASDNPDVPDWLRDHGCEAYQEPGVARIIDMIFDCRCRMLRYALPRSPLAVAPPGVDTGAALRRSILGHHRRYIDAALQQAARNARVDVLAVAHEAGLYDDAFPILVGAAQNCCVDVMEWAASTGQIDGLTRVQARALVAGVCSSCAGDAAGALEWIVGRFGIDVVDRAMIAAAFHHFRLDAVRWIEARLLQHDRPFDWASLVPGALRTGYVAGLRYLVEEKRVRIETSHIVAAEAVGHRALGYVLSRSPLSVLQDAVDIMGTRLTCKDIETLECVRELAPQLCVSIAAAACSVSDALIHVTCECARCLDDAHVLGVAESSTAASKRAFPIAPDEVDTDHSAGACPAPKRLMLSPQR
jgi:hypothetical protein